jgi:probable HAF family extracellular repeat protein
MRRHSLFLLGTIALAPGTALAAPVYTITDLGTLGGDFSFSRGINASGQVTGLSDTAGGTDHAFLWDPQSGMHDLGTLGGQASNVGDIDIGGINASGQVTGYSNTVGPADSITFHAFLLDPQSGMHDLGTLGGDSSAGQDINDSGQVTGESNTAGHASHAFLWDPQSGMHDLGTLPGGDSSFGSYGYGINASGQVTGYSYINDASHAFLWNGSSMLDLNDLIPSGLGWELNSGDAINDAGQIAGSGSIGIQSHAFVLTPIAVVEVSEPGTLALIGAGVIGLGLLRRRTAPNDPGT